MVEFVVGWKHPYPSFLWETLRNTDTLWQPVTVLTGYVSGETGDTLVIGSAVVADEGQLRCTISNPSDGTVTTRFANLTIGSILFTEHPDDLTVYGGVPAFPGAVGFGSTTSHARFGDVYKVTNLDGNRTTPILGSLFYGIDVEAANKPLNIIFEVSGVIEVEDFQELKIDNPNIAIYGETAPYPGITIKNGGASVNNTNDVLIRHIKFRPGDYVDGHPPDVRRGVTVGKSHRVVIDHCSITWAIDINASVTFNGTVTGTTGDITFSNCMISQCLNNAGHSSGDHAYNFAVQWGCGNVTGYRNFMADGRARHPLQRSGTNTAIVNNYIYGAVHACIDFSDGGNTSDAPGFISLVGNEYEPMASEVTQTDYLMQVNSPMFAGSEYYVEDNISPSWDTINPETVVNDLGGGASRVLSPTTAIDQYEATPASGIFASLELVVGARSAERLYTDIDYSIIQKAKEDTGVLIDSPDDVGGYDTTENTVPLVVPPDHDQDSGNGYSNLEIWIQGMAAAIEAPSAPYSTEALAAINRMSNPSFSQRNAIAKFVDSQVLSTNWTASIDEFYCHALSEAGGDWLTGWLSYPAATVVGGVTRGENGAIFIDDVTNNYLDTGIIPDDLTNYTASDASAGAFIHDLPALDTTQQFDVFGMRDAGGGRLRLRLSVASADIQINNGGSVLNAIDRNADVARKLYSVNRDAGISSLKIDKVAQATTGAGADNSPTLNSVWIGSFNNEGAPGADTRNHTVTSFYIGGPLVDHDDFYDNLLILHAALGVA